MKVLIACAFSGTTRDAFARRGHDAWSCDILPCDTGGQHFQGDVRTMLKRGWDLIIAHPPCTYLTVSGNRWLNDTAKARPGILTGAARRAAQAAGAAFARELYDAPCPRVCVENPVGRLSTLWRRPDQVVQPWWFGHPEFKGTCYWLRGLPKLLPTDVLVPPEKGTDEFHQWSRVHMMTPGEHRWKERSRALSGISEAMAEQWG